MRLFATGSRSDLRRSSGCILWQDDICNRTNATRRCVILFINTQVYFEVLRGVFMEDKAGPDDRPLQTQLFEEDIPDKTNTVGD